MFSTQRFLRTEIGTMVKQEAYYDCILRFALLGDVTRVPSPLRLSQGKKSVESFRNHCVIEQKIITQKSHASIDFRVIFCSITQ